MGKICTWCKELKSSDEFPYDSRRRDERDSHCNTCCNRRTMRWRYNITPEQKIELLKQQGNVCGICKSPDPKGKHGWHVDHDHSTNKIRGILCHSCNIRLDWAINNKKAIINYLERENINA